MADKRIDATRAKIKRAFTELVAERGLDRLSMSDIARRADLNRGTLYLHFTDKFDMLAQFENEALESIFHILFDNPEREPAGATFDPAQFIPSERLLAALRFVQHDAAFFTALTGQGGDPLFAERLKEALGDHLIEEAERVSGGIANIEGVSTAYAREIALGSINAIVMLWLKNGAQEPAEHIARIIDIAKRTAPLDLLDMPRQAAS
ncbi:TetR/AcrR family transcriptional regulator [Enorma sp.]|uniref:TetR/AcrR family transcriptional regulator n=1 Tax=Enorma sp. TaxID=1920692 RepID=UPI0025BF6ACB|nr:TetR/AcrR family transcriptional regulator [Enorma sp.]